MLNVLRHSRLFILNFSLVSSVIVSNCVHAESSSSNEINPIMADDSNIEEVIITGGKDAIQTLPGSAHFISPEDLETFQYTDIQQIVANAPGVYTRSEDGYGLRPNIGIRGVTSERSQKVALMEDGILIAPAAYSAPSAYYFPNAARMHAIEVFKGPVGIKYGPHTIGGAINMVSTPIPSEAEGMVNVLYGTDNYHKLHTSYGASGEKFSYLVEALRLGADGFKRFDSTVNSDDTGFVRNDIRVKFAYDINDKHTLKAKIGFADEDSNETYTGLTIDDFKENSDRRYFATQKDRMLWRHRQLELSHIYQHSDDTTLTTRIYHNEFERAWNKLDNNENWLFSLKSILDNPTGAIQRQYYLILTGQREASNANELIKLTNNGREYYSQGVQFTFSHDLFTGDWEHSLQAGLRIHQDGVDRHHTAQLYAVEETAVSSNQYRMVESGAEFDDLVNEAKTRAVSFYISDEIDYKDFSFTTGVRLEKIDGELKEGGETKKSDQRAVLFSFGGFYQWTDSLGLLAGFYQGFSPAAPGSNADPEEGVNFEYGLRYQADTYNVELIGFFNQYDQQIFRCRASDTGCKVGEDFNSGSAETSGVELTAASEFELSNGWLIPLKLVYTFTESIFTESFFAPNSQLGDVQKGDRLPYLPEHSLRAEAGIESDVWRMNLALNYVSEMRDSASYEPFSEVLSTESLTTLDFAANYQLNPQLDLSLKVDNLTDEEAIVSYRPFGARPNKPRSVIAGARWFF